MRKTRLTWILTLATEVAGITLLMKGRLQSGVVLVLAGLIFIIVSAAAANKNSSH